MNIFKSLLAFFTPVRPLPEGVHHLQSAPQGRAPFRLHLRLQKDGSGILIINASTVLQLNPSAAEYAYHLIKGTDPLEAAKTVAARYRVKKSQALADFSDFMTRILTLAQTEDLDPVSTLGFERVAPNSAALTAPLRLDCALTYRLPPAADPLNAPDKRVTRELTSAEWQQIIDLAWAHGVPHIVFTGGEATLRPDLPELIARAEQNGQVTGLLTDGHKLADPAYLNTLLQTGLDHLMMILPSDAEPNWQALQNAIAADIFLAVHLTLTPQNLSAARPLMRKLHQAGIEALSLSLSDPALHEELSRLRDFAAELGLRLVADLPVPYSAANPVALETADEDELPGAGRAWLYVEPDGDVLPAQGMAETILGNLLTDPWEKIYH
ncbi:MAG: hypothetical protein OHK0031_02010 [Anaerolineales bacterium]